MASPDFTVADLLAWVRSKPADEAYDYYDLDGCALAQFLTATGRSLVPNVGGFGDWEDVDGDEHIAPDGVWQATARDPETFGGLVSRLETLVLA